MAINKIRLPDNSEHTLDAELLDGYSAQKYYPAVAYNFTTGCFCKTTLDAGANTIYIEIVGRNHATTGSFVNTQAKAQYGSGAFVSEQCKAVRYGDSIGNITFCVHDGKICFWFKVATAYCSFYVICRSGGAPRNYIGTITNETIPSDATGNLTITPTVAFEDTYMSASFTESDPIFTASAAHGISSSDISNWNAKPNVYTGTSVPDSSLGSDGDIYLQVE